MSIWCSWEHIGFSDDRDPGMANRGQVRSYASGWSNHYPTSDGEVEQEAEVSLAHIPEWCVPGNDDSGDEHVIGAWVRLDIHSPQARTWWAKDESGDPAIEPVHGSVVLDEEAATLLRDQLDAWLRKPKAYPNGETA